MDGFTAMRAKVPAGLQAGTAFGTGTCCRNGSRGGLAHDAVKNDDSQYHKDTKSERKEQSKKHKDAAHKTTTREHTKTSIILTASHHSASFIIVIESGHHLRAGIFFKPAIGKIVILLTVVLTHHALALTILAAVWTGVILIVIIRVIPAWTGSIRLPLCWVAGLTCNSHLPCLISRRLLEPEPGTTDKPCGGNQQDRQYG